MINEVDEEVAFKVNAEWNYPSERVNSTSEHEESSESIRSQSQSLFAGLPPPVATHPNNASESIMDISEHEETSESIQSQSQSLFAGISTPLTRKMKYDINASDKFNGILYHIIPSTSAKQISIIFSSPDLYNKFISAIDKELTPRRINNDGKACYTTHLKGKWCVLTSDDKDSTISATGPGRDMWRETHFTRLSIRLYQQYATEVEQDNHSAHKSQASTPAMDRLFLSPTPPLSPVATQAPQNGTQLEQPSKSEIITQITELKQSSKTMQEQLHNINVKLDSLLSMHTSPRVVNPVSPPGLLSGALSGNHTIHELSDSTLDPDGFVTLSRTGENLQLIPGNTTYSDSLTKNLPGNEKTDAHSKAKENVNPVPSNKQTNKTANGKTHAQNKQSGNHGSNDTGKQQQKQYGYHMPHNAEVNTPHRTLLIGDSILSGVNRKGLNKYVECLPIPGAKIDTIIDRIQLYDLTKFNSIVIYAGGNNSASQTDSRDFEEKYVELLASISAKTPNCKAYLCTSCPRGDTNVTEVNSIIKQLCVENGMVCIDANSAFFDKSQQLRSHFYKPRDNVHLSRSGVKRLMGSINQHVHVVDNFEHCVYPITSSYPRPDYNNHGQQPRQYENTGNSPRVEESHQPNRLHGNDHTGNRGQEPNSYEHSRNSPRTEESRLSNHPHGYDYGQTDNEWRTPRMTYQHNYRDDNNEGYRQEVDTRSGERCLKCGLNNHYTDDCRHRTQVQCYKCKYYGHKDSSGLCWKR